MCDTLKKRSILNRKAEELVAKREQAKQQAALLESYHDKEEQARDKYEDFEQVSNGLGGIQSSLMSLDFEEAAEKSKVFAKTLGSINPAEIGKAMSGLVTTVGTLGTMFLCIKINPIPAASTLIS